MDVHVWCIIELGYTLRPTVSISLGKKFFEESGNASCRGITADREARQVNAGKAERASAHRSGALPAWRLAPAGDRWQNVSSWFLGNFSSQPPANIYIEIVAHFVLT